LPPRILYAARCLQLCGRTQAEAWLADLIATSFHPRLFPQVVDGGRTFQCRTWPEHVYVAAAGSLDDARYKESPECKRQDGWKYRRNRIKFNNTENVLVALRREYEIARLLWAVGLSTAVGLL
jgi:hypothetical protein